MYGAALWPHKWLVARGECPMNGLMSVYLTTKSYPIMCIDLIDKAPINNRKCI